MEIDKKLPAELELEKKLIGCLFHFIMEKQEKELKISLSKINGDMFYYDVTKIIYLQMNECMKNNIIPDAIIIENELKKKNLLEQIGGLIMIAELEQQVTSDLNITYLIHQLKELKFRRDLIKETFLLSEKSYDEENSIYELKNDIKGIVNISKQKIFAECKDMNTTIQQALTLIKENQGTEGNYIVKTGIEAIDNVLTLMRRQMFTLSAPSGTGKTALALSMMIAQAKIKIKTIYFCGESTAQELILRIISILTGFSLDDLINGTVTSNPQKFARFQSALEYYKKDLSEYIIIYGKGEYEHSTNSIAEILRAESSTHKFGWAYFDYLQNMKAPDGITDEAKAISENIASLDDIITENDVVGCVMAQINRQANLGRPRYVHLKGSSSIENYSHVIAFLFKQSTVDMREKTIEIDFYSDKTRIVKPFDIKLGFNQHNAEFVSLPKYDASYNPR